MKKIALVLASIHTGSSVTLWKEIAELAEASGDQLFVFPGGRIAYQENQEYLRNEIYALVNPDNVEGMLVWASALSGAVSIEEVEAYLYNEELPTVSIGVKRSAWPCVAFDAYAGMQTVIHHVIETHHVKKIAFLRGPEHHDSAQSRYNAYIDTLQHYRIDVDPLLISDPVGWTEGKRAVKQLLDERCLVPGRDFDTLVCSSDLMMFGAGKHLEQLGYITGRDYIITGFNDSRESRLLKVGCTTARMPVVNLARISYSLLGQNLAGDDSLLYDITLPCPLIIRRSCGCTYALGDEEHARSILVNETRFAEWISEHLEVTKEEEPLLDSFLAGDFGVLSQFARSYFDREGDPNHLTEMIHWYQKFFAKKPFDNERIMGDLLAIQDLVTHEHAYERDCQEKLLNNLKSDLLTVRRIPALGMIMAQHLPDLGITDAYLMLDGEEGVTTLVGGYRPEGPIRTQEQFSSRLLLPQHYSQALGKGVFVILPLSVDNQSIGYLLVRSTRFNAVVLEDVRTSLSSAIKGALLVESANKARDLAEKTERSHAEFFANISEALRAPLEEILEITSDVTIANHVHHLFNTIDLSLSYTPEFTLEQRTFDPLALIRRLGSVAYSGPSRLPILVGDSVRLGQALEILSGSKEVVLEARLADEGVELFLRIHVEAEAQRDVAMRIIVMNGGQIHFDEHGVRILLPFPSVLGRAKKTSGTRKVYFRGDQEEVLPPFLSELPDLEVVQASGVKSRELEAFSSSTLYWDGSRDDGSLRRLLFQIIAHSELSTCPFVCYDTPVGHETLAVGLAVSKPQEGSLVITGSLGPYFGFLRDAMVVEAREVPKLLQDTVLGLLICDCIDADFLIALRKKTSAPFVLLRDDWSPKEVETLGLIPNVVLAHTSITSNPDFIARLSALRSLGDVLPPLTGILVKKAVAYIDEHATEGMTRWQLAEAVHVSEDYLTRIFRKEIGVSPWEYINNHRIHKSINLLRHSTLTIAEIAGKCGFQDQAYFTRVFRKITGKSPTMVRLDGK